MSEIDAALESQASLLGVHLNVETGYLADDTLGHTEPVRRVDIAGSVARLPELIQLYESALAAPEKPQVEAWLAELSVIVARRPDDAFTDTLRLDAYCARLNDYPVDVVHEALIEVLWKYWPSWAELKDVCDKLIRHRLCILDNLRKAAERGTADPEEKRRASTAERRASSRRIMAEVFGKAPVERVA